MKIAKCLIFIFLLAGPGFVHAQRKKQNVPQQVLIRFIGEKAREINFRTIPDDKKHPGKMVFEIDARGGKVTISGNTTVAQLRGAYTYLKEACNSMITWSGQNIQIPDTWPQYERKRVVVPFRYNLQDNVCVFGYTTPYYKWPEWERYLDIMALHGYNMMYAPVGMEAIWRRVWNQMGITDEELSDFFTGPSFFPWQRMGNVNRHSGPVPFDFFPQTISLQKQILNRMRELDIIPIAPAFAGFVPREFQARYPDAQVLAMRGYGEFTQETASHVLHPLSPYFSQIGKSFMDEWEKEFGQAEFFFADTFNENKAPVSDLSEEIVQKELAQFGNAIYSSIAQVKPRATWVMMAWKFLDREFWSNERVAAFLSDIPNDKMMILDLYVESNPQYPRLNNFYGKQWMYSVIPNWGGSNHLGGLLTKYGKLIHDIRQQENIGNLVGFGYSPEGTENNEVLYEMASDAVWSDKAIDLEEWLKGYCKSRYGEENMELVRAWQLLARGVYDREVFHPVNVFQSRPDGTSLRAGTAYWDDIHLNEALDLFLKNSGQFRNNELFINDLIEIAAFHFSALADQHALRLRVWVRQRDYEKAGQEMQRLKKLATHIDQILSGHTIFNLDRWVDLARDWGLNPDQKDYYEEDAKRIITFWGAHLSEYSARLWSGLVENYYMARWEEWYNAHKNGRPFNMREWEQQWVKTPGNYKSEEAKDVIALIKELRSNRISGDSRY